MILRSSLMKRALLIALLSPLVILPPSLGFVILPKHSAESHLTLLEATTKKEEPFPVLSRIQGIDWEGDCRYVDGNLTPVSLPLHGGTRYDLEQNGTCTLTSFLVFPNGKRRQVQMQGKMESTVTTVTALRLDPVDLEGPISMVLTELPPDTILINELDRSTGKIIMTSSLSVVNDGTELVQVAHEVGGKENGAIIEGHQVWRLHQLNEFA